MGEQKAISKAQARVLEYIRKFHQQHGYMPSLRDICGGLSLTSVSTASYHLKMLQRAGHLKRQFDRSRAIVLVGQSNTTTEREESLLQINVALARDLAKTIDERDSWKNLANSAIAENEELKKRLEGFERMAALSQEVA